MNILTRRQQLIYTLSSGNNSLVVADTGGKIFTFRSRGVIDLMHILKATPEILRDAEVADRVIGKGAAAIMAVGGVKWVYTPVASRAAIDLFHKAGIEVEADTIVNAIINRTKTGFCPVETLCHDIDNPQECIPLIEKYLETTASKQQ